MNITISETGDTLTLRLDGRVTSDTAPELDAAIKSRYARARLLILDMEGVEYLSSAGLRVLLSTQRAMSRRGRLVLRHVSSAVRQLFVTTGFLGILTLE